MLSAPDPVQFSHCRCFCCDPHADVCRGDVVSGQDGSQLQAVYLFDPYFIDVDVCFAIADNQDLCHSVSNQHALSWDASALTTQLSV